MYLQINVHGKLQCLSEEMQELVDMLHKTCVEETGAAEGSKIEKKYIRKVGTMKDYFSEDIVNARMGDFSESDNFKCYIKCLMTQMACVSIKL